MDITLHKPVGDSLAVDVELNYGTTTNQTRIANKNFLDEYNAREEQNPLLPAGILYVDRMERNIIFQMPPVSKTIKYHIFEQDAYIEDAEESDIMDVVEYEIQLPWTVYMGSFDLNGNMDSSYMFLSTTQIREGHGVLLQSPFPNFFRDNRVCRAYTNEQPANTIEDMLHATYDSIWGSNFNRDTLDSFMMCMRNRRFPESFRFRLDDNMIEQVRSFSDGGDYSTLLAEEYLLKFLESYSKMSVSHVTEVVAWPRASWGDVFSPGVYHLIHWIETNNRAFDETALGHALWSGALYNPAPA